MEYSSSLSAATVKQLELQTIVGLAAAACISHILAYVMLVVPTADCYFWDEDFVAFQFEIFNIAGWSTDGGAALHKQEDGCGALTFWTWDDATSTDAAYVYFDLPVVLKAGCVERAVKSAGGPSLSCQGQGDEFPVRKRSPNSNSSIAAAPPVPPLTSQKLRTLQIVYGNNTDRSYKYTPQDWTKPDPS